MRLTVIVAIVLCSISFLAPGAIGQVQNEQIVDHLPRVLPQKKTPWCFAFVARSVFSQYLCAKTAHCQKAEEMAVANFISSYIEANPLSKLTEDLQLKNPAEGREWWMGGDAAVALEHMTNHQTPIVQYHCSNEKQVLDLSDLVPFMSTSFLLETILKNYKEQRARDPSVTKELFIRASGAQPEVVQKLLWIAPHLDLSKDFSDFTKNVMLPPECLRGRLPKTPNFRVKQVLSMESSEIETAIDGALSRNSLAGLAVCAGTLDPSLGECGPHMTAVGGVRQNCNQRPCKKEYLFLDSSFFADAPRNADGTMWISAKLIISAAQSYARMISSHGYRIQDSLEDLIRTRDMTIASYSKLKGDLVVPFAANLSEMDAQLVKAKEGILSIDHLSAQQRTTQLAKLQSQFDLARESAEQRQHQLQNSEQLRKSFASMERSIQSLENSIAVLRNLKFTQNNVFWLE